MRSVLSTVYEASVYVEGTKISSVSSHSTGSLLALVGISINDTQADVHKTAEKIAKLRILPAVQSAPSELDYDNKRTNSALDNGAPVLLVSQFTLMGDTSKGTRPSWSNALQAHESEVFSML